MKRSVFLVLCSILFASAVCADVEKSHREKLFDRDGDRLFENLQERLNRAKADELLPVVILFKENTPLAGTYAARLSGIPARKVKHSYRNLPAVSMSLTPREIEQVRKDAWVEHIEYDARVKAAMNTARASFGVDSVRNQFGFTGNRDGIKGNYSKNDIVVAVVDSGVNDGHPDLRGKVLFWKDYIAQQNRPYDDNGHGTHVSSVILGAGKEKKKYIGVAPEAALVALRVLDHSGSGTVSDSIAAVDEVIARKSEFNIRVLNLSLAVSGSSSGRDAFSLAANRAVAAGIVVVAAAGNEGPDSDTIGAPSAASKVITVGAGADLGERGFSLARFSSRGPTADGRIKPDLWAPGVRITSARGGSGYAIVSGTSFATPFVSGVAALMLEANPSLLPGRVKSILMGSSQKWSPTKSNETGRGRLQAYNAITRAAAITQNLNPPKVPQLFFVKAPIAPNETKIHPFQVTATKNNIAITVILNPPVNGGFKIELVNSSGNVVAQTTEFSRQALLSVKPTSTGNYAVRVQSQGSSSTYLLDISAD